MNLAVDAFNLASDRRGMGRFVRHTLRELAALGTSIALVAPNGTNAAAPAPEFELPVIEPRRLARERFDAVWYPWNGMRFAPHAPAIVTIYDAFAFTQPHRSFIARHREQLPICRAVVKADRILTISQWSASELQRIFTISDARLSVLCLSPDPFWKRVEGPAGDSYMLFLGGREPRKNAAMLLRAYDAAFFDGGPLLLVGGTLSDSDERTLSRLRAPHRRIHPGDEELRALYSGATAVLVPSLAEGFGLPAVEAMACGAPVIASNASALPEACGDAALLLPPEEEAAWCSAMRTLTHDRTLREDLRQRGFARIARMDRTAAARAILSAIHALSC